MAATKAYKLAFNGKEFKTFYFRDQHAADLLWKRLSLNETQFFGVDIETAKRAEYLNHPKAGLDPYLSMIRLLQIYDGETVYVFDMFDIEITNNLKQLFYLKQFVAHNAIFEMKFFKHFGVSEKPIGCSRLLAILVDRAERSPFEKEELYEDDDEPDGMSQYRTGYDLASVTGRLYGVKTDKYYQTANWNLHDLPTEQVLYAALDAVLTYDIAKTLVPKLNTYKMAKIYQLLKNVQPAVVQMELSGMLLAQDQHELMIKEWAKADAAAIKTAKKYIPVLNMNSPKQLGDWARSYFPAAVIDSWPRTPTKGLTFNKAKIAHLAKDPAIAALLEHKKYYKLLSTYGYPLHEFINPVTGRIHSSFGIGSTTTGRFSSRDPNLQNLPRSKAVRNLFVEPAGENSCMIVADYNQIEMRVAGEVSRDPVILNAYKTGQDLHANMARRLLGKGQMYTPTKEERQMAKAVNFGLLFGMGAEKLSAYAFAQYGVAMTIDQAMAAVDIFRAEYAVYTKWQWNERNKCERLGFARTPAGKMRKLLPDEIYTKSVNTPVQGGAAEVIQSALIHCHRLGLHLINCVHDEILIKSTIEHAKEDSKLLEYCMVKGMLEIFPKATTNKLVEATIGNAWGDCKE